MVCRLDLDELLSLTSRVHSLAPKVISRVRARGMLLIHSLTKGAGIVAESEAQRAFELPASAGGARKLQ